MCQCASSGTTDGRIISSMCMNSHPVSRLRAAKGLSRSAARCFAALSMTGLDFAIDAELSRAFEPCLSPWLLKCCYYVFITNEDRHILVLQIFYPQHIKSCILYTSTLLFVLQVFIAHEYPFREWP